LGAIESRRGFDFDAVELRDKAVEQGAAERGASHLAAAAEAQDHLDLVSLPKELADLARLRLEVARPDAHAQPHLLQFVAMRLSSCILRLRDHLEPVLAVIHDLANGRVGVGCDLDKIEVQLAGQRQRVSNGSDAELATLGVDQPYLSDADPLVDALLLLGVPRRTDGSLLSRVVSAAKVWPTTSHVSTARTGTPSCTVAGEMRSTIAPETGADTAADAARCSRAAVITPSMTGRATPRISCSGSRSITE
jgi:hypothetical protein